MEMNKHSNSLTNVFQQLSDQPKSITPDMLDTIAKFIYHVYNPNQRQNSSFSQMRMQQLIKTPDVNMRLLVPSIVGILQHIKRSCIQAGWLWKLCEVNVEIPNPDEWGWRRQNDSFIPVWQDDEPFDILSILKCCSCQKGTYSSCSCQKSEMNCLTYCKCERDKCNNS